MNIYAAYTESHSVLAGTFLQSIQEPGVNVHLRVLEQTCPSATYRTEGWLATQLKKVDYWIEAARKNPNQPFVFSDVDVVVMRPIVKWVAEQLGAADLIFQSNGVARGRPLLCSGFFAGVGSSATLEFLKRVREVLPKYAGDEAALNDVYEHAMDIEVALFDEDAVWSLRKSYSGMPPLASIAPATSDVYVFHANWLLFADKLKAMRWFEERRT